MMLSVIFLIEHYHVLEHSEIISYLFPFDRGILQSPRFSPLLTVLNESVVLASAAALPRRQQNLRGSLVLTPALLFVNAVSSQAEARVLPCVARWPQQVWVAFFRASDWC